MMAELPPGNAQLLNDDISSIWW